MRKQTSVSVRRACRLAGISRTVLGYQPTADPSNAALGQRLVELASERRRFGYRRLHVLLRREGVSVNHKRVWRLYREAGLAVRRRRRRRGVAVEREPLALPTAPNQVWSMDFVMDAPSSGRRVKCLTIVDDFTKEAVDIVPDHSIPGPVCDAGARPSSAVSGSASGYSHRPGAGVYWPRARPIGLSQRSAVEAHRAGEPDTERLHRELQWQVPRRVLERPLVRNVARRSCHHHGVAARP